MTGTTARAGVHGMFKRLDPPCIAIAPFGHWRATLTSAAGEVHETEEGWYDVPATGTLSVRAVTEGRPRFETTIQLGAERWRRSERHAGRGGWQHEAARPHALRPFPGAGTTLDRVGDLQLVVSVMGESIERAMGLTGPATGPVVVHVDLDDGELAGWCVELDELVATARALGHAPGRGWAAATCATRSRSPAPTAPSGSPRRPARSDEMAASGDGPRRGPP